MATKKINYHQNLQQNEIQNGVDQNLSSAPSTPKEGQFYWNTSTKEDMIYNGTAWVSRTAQGTTYTFNSPLSESSGTVSVGDASTSAKGVIEIATDTEASTGTDTTRAINAKQLATKVTANTAITGATHTKITYDSKGLVTAGADLSASDIPNLTLSKITDVTATASEVNVLDGITATTAELNILDGVTATATELNVLDGITASTTELNYVDGVTSSIQTQLNNKVAANSAITGGTATKITYDSKGLVTSGASLSASDIPDISATYQTKLSSTNKLSASYVSGLATVATSGSYSDLTGTPTVDQTYSGTSTNAQSGVAVKSAIDTAISSVYKPAGSVAFANRPSLSSSIEGNVYNITDSFTTTSDFVEGAGSTYPAGTNIVCINTTGTTYKWDVLAGFIDTSSFITASSTATFTNKTFNANGTGNSITNLETADFASGVIQTSVRATSSASDTSLATEKAVATAITGMAKKFVATNPALTASGGQCTWTISNTLGTEECGVFVKEVSSNEYVDCYYEVTSSNVIIKINSSSNITAGKYKAIIVG